MPPLRLRIPSTYVCNFYVIEFGDIWRLASLNWNLTVNRIPRTFRTFPKSLYIILSPMIYFRQSVSFYFYFFQFYHALVNNVKICEKFCVLASQGNLENKSKEISKLDKNFQKYKSMVLCFLSEYQSQPFKQHLIKLLLRLNFNHWVNKNLLKIPDWWYR